MQETITRKEQVAEKNTTTKLAQSMADYRTPSIKRQWYVAGRLEEFGEDLQEIVIMNRSLVRYRTSSGEPVLMQNRCPHRSYPLSESIREGDNIRCRYHGATFDSDGVFVRVPSQDICPKGGLRKYPLVEIGPFVWVWMANESPDYSLLPELPYTQGDWKLIIGRFDVPGNIMFMAENLCDLSHLPYLHEKTLGYPPEFAKEQLEIRQVGNGLEYERKISGQYYHKTVFFSQETSDLIDPCTYSMSNIGYFKSTALNYSYVRLMIDPADVAKYPGLQEEYGFIISHYLTPETDKTTHYYWLLARNYDMDKTSVDQQLESGITAAFMEDIETTQLLQDMMEKDHEPYREVIFGGDKVAVMMRRIVKQLADQEAKDKVTQ